MTRIYINADDFGLNSSVNKAIIELFGQGIINSTTIMANMPAVNEAVELAHKHELTDKIGIHLVLTEGIPLTEEIRSVNFLFRGKALFNKFRHLTLLKKYQRQIFNEFSAQIEKIQSMNIAITHLDTHHHVHEVYGITTLLFDLQKKYNIPSIRILNNLEKSNKFHKHLYRQLINYYIMKKNANYSDLFGNRSDFLLLLKDDPSLIGKKSIEIMVHPDYNLEGQLIDKEGNLEYDYIFLKSLKSMIFNNETHSNSL